MGKLCRHFPLQKPGQRRAVSQRPQSAFLRVRAVSDMAFFLLCGALFRILSRPDFWPMQADGKDLVNDAADAASLLRQNGLPMRRCNSRLFDQHP
jgi:hypothetical protein